MNTNDSTENTYKLSLTGNDITVSKDISAELAHQIVLLLMPSRAARTPYPHEQEVVRNGVNAALTPKEFMVQKRPSTDIERVTCLAYYLDRYRDTREFKVKELTDLNREAQQVKFSNPSAAARNAVQLGYLTSPGGGRKQITSTGEAVVEALPDRAQVKEVLGNGIRHRRRRGRKTSNRRPAKEEMSGELGA